MDKGKKSCTSHKGKKETFFSLMKPLSISRQRQEKKGKKTQKRTLKQTVQITIFGLLYMWKVKYTKIYLQKRKTFNIYENKAIYTTKVFGFQKKRKIEIEYFSSGQINYSKFLRFFCFCRIKHLSKFKAKKVRFSS